MRLRIFARYCHMAGILLSTYGAWRAYHAHDILGFGIYGLWIGYLFGVDWP